MSTSRLEHMKPEKKNSIAMMQVLCSIIITTPYKNLKISAALRFQQRQRCLALAKAGQATLAAVFDSSRPCPVEIDMVDKPGLAVDIVEAEVLIPNYWVP
jgi:hypothetical protein